MRRKLFLLWGLLCVAGMVCITASFLAGFYLGGPRRLPFTSRFGEWSIGIYEGSSPLALAPSSRVRNPVLTARDVTDAQALSIADPFMLHANGKWHMFFEVLPHGANADIGLATSTDGLSWSYDRIVLNEPFHVTYPQVFRHEGAYYMIPETNEDLSIRLYRADPFPTKWALVRRLVSGYPYVDPTLFQHGNRWWLFASLKTNDVLYLFHADRLEGPWQPHPANPIVRRDARCARPAGRIQQVDGRMFRLAQDDSTAYGSRIRAFEILALTPTEYREREVEMSPSLGASGSGWNAVGMHHLDAHHIGEGRWMASVDGCRSRLLLRERWLAPPRGAAQEDTAPEE